MIVFRYLTKEVLFTLLAVTLVLLLVFLSNQIIRWLNEAASGEIASSVLMNLVLLETPYLLGLLLPLGLFLGILVTYTRLYSEHEMTILSCSGMSRWQLTSITLNIASIVFVVVVILVMWANPLIASQKNKLVSESASNIITTLVPGHFQTLQDDSQVVYVDAVSSNPKMAEKVFMAQKPAKNEGSAEWVVLSAEKAKQIFDAKSKERFIAVEDGYRYQGTPGNRDYQVTKYEEYAIKAPEYDKKSRESEAIPTFELLIGRKGSLEYFSELQWRMALPISVFVLALLAMTLSKVKPRGGRFKMLVPAILLYMFYANFILIGKDWLESGVTPAVFGLWWVHGIMILIIILINLWQLGTARR